MNLRDYYNKEAEYTSKELLNFFNDSSDANRQKVLNKRRKFKEIIIQEHEYRVEMTHDQKERDRLVKDLESIRKVIVSDK